MRKIIIIVLGLFLVVGCSETPVIEPTVKIEVAVSPTKEEIPPSITPTKAMVTKTPQPTVELTVRPMSLSEEGPWHVFYDDDNAFVTNADGSGYLTFTGLKDVQHPRLTLIISSQYNVIGVSTNTNQIYLYQLPFGNLIQKIDLFICPEDMPDCEFNEWFYMGIPTWSPNGQYLAFTAARGGVDTDLYIYDANKDKINQLTNGVNNVGHFFWSPDSKWIVHQEINLFSDSSQISLWAANVTEDSVNWLASSSNGDIQVLGWINNQQFIIWNRYFEGGDLRLLDTQTGLINKLFDGTFDDHPNNLAINLISGAIAFFPFPYEQESGTYQSGIYLVSPYQTTPYFTGLYRNGEKIFWDTISSDFIALGYECTTQEGLSGDAYAFNIDGKINCVVAPEEPLKDQLDYIVVGGE